MVPTSAQRMWRASAPQTVPTSSALARRALGRERPSPAREGSQKNAGEKPHFSAPRGGRACHAKRCAQMVSKVRVYGSVRKAIASEGGNKSVPCSRGLMSASSSPNDWARRAA
eukprot:7384397-Prymnesium_polylepis.1